MNKVVSCILCVLPLVLYVLVAAPLLVLSIGMELGTYDESAVLPLSIVLFVGALVLVVATYGVMIWLIVKTVKTVKNVKLSTTAKVVWSLCLYFLNILAFPVYWFMNIRKE